MSDSERTARHRSREVALQALFALDLRMRRRPSDALAAGEQAAGGERGSDGTAVAPHAEPPLAPAVARVAAERPAAQEIFDAVSEHFEMPEAARTFAKELVCGVADHLEEIDAALSEAARNWRVDRMAVVDRNVLRLAAYELIVTDTPTAVILDEAVKMAQRFGDDPSPGFVNGVIDAVAHAQRGAGG